MKRETFGVILLAMGTLAVLLALGANLVGLGGKGVFGGWQIWGVLSGAAAAAVGVLSLAYRA